MKILHLDSSMEYGDREKDHIHEALEFRRSGHVYWIGASFGSPLYREANQYGVSVSFQFTYQSLLSFFFNIRNFIINNEIDILITTNQSDSIIGWVVAASLQKKRPVVIRQRHFINPAFRILSDLNFSDYLTTDSNASKLLITDRKIPFWRVAVLPRGIPTPNSEATSAHLPKISPKDQVALQIGSMERHGGQLSLVENMLPHLKDNQHLHLVLVGDGPLKSFIKRRIMENRFLDVRSRIHLPGWCITDPLFKSASVVIISSIQVSYSPEILKCLYFGIPLVGFRQGNLSEFTSVVGLGDLVDPWDFRKLCQKAIDCLNCKDKIILRRNELKRIFDNKYAITRSVERTQQFYAWAIEQKKLGKININQYAINGGKSDPFFQNQEEIE